MSRPRYYATQHARAMARERLGYDLTNATWREIVANARAGLYERRKPRPMPPRARRIRKIRAGRAPVFLVPMGEPGGIRLLVPIAICLRDEIAITVLPWIQPLEDSLRDTP